MMEATNAKKDNSQKQPVQERRVLLSYPTLVLAQRVRDYLCGAMTIAADLGIEVEPRETASPHGRRISYNLTVTPFFFTYRLSVEKCIDAAKDFIAGYQAGMDEAIRMWRSTLKVRQVHDFKSVKWDDPVGQGAGLRCKRVLRSKESGAYYIATWDRTSSGKLTLSPRYMGNDPGQLAGWLSRRDLLPMPPWVPSTEG